MARHRRRSTLRALICPGLGEGVFFRAGAISEQSPNRGASSTLVFAICVRQIRAFFFFVFPVFLRHADTVAWHRVANLPDANKDQPERRETEAGTSQGESDDEEPHERAFVAREFVPKADHRRRAIQGHSAEFQRTPRARPEAAKGAVGARVVATRSATEIPAATNRAVAHVLCVWWAFCTATARLTTRPSHAQTSVVALELVVHGSSGRPRARGGIRLAHDPNACLRTLDCQARGRTARARAVDCAQCSSPHATQGNGEGCADVERGAIAPTPKMQLGPCAVQALHRVDAHCAASSDAATARDCGRAGAGAPRCTCVPRLGPCRDRVALGTRSEYAGAMWHMAARGRGPTRGWVSNSDCKLRRRDEIAALVVTRQPGWPAPNAVVALELLLVRNVPNDCAATFAGAADGDAAPMHHVGRSPADATNVHAWHRVFDDEAVTLAVEARGLAEGAAIFPADERDWAPTAIVAMRLFARARHTPVPLRAPDVQEASMLHQPARVGGVAPASVRGNFRNMARARCVASVNLVARMELVRWATRPALGDVQDAHPITLEAVEDCDVAVLRSAEARGARHLPHAPVRSETGSAANPVDDVGGTEDESLTIARASELRLCPTAVLANHGGRRGRLQGSCRRAVATNHLPCSTMVQPSALDDVLPGADCVRLTTPTA
mmetsp:Transcript_522/g.1225  ORF Transcript_522/g.1225 Transcript_522/m.1225 type:complete len:669 (+) Transcript_522:734-2740(+)